MRSRWIRGRILGGLCRRFRRADVAGWSCGCFLFGMGVRHRAILGIERVSFFGRVWHTAWVFFILHGWAPWLASGFYRGGVLQRVGWRASNES